MKRILFTVGGGAGAAALWRLLGGRYDLLFADADRDKIPPIIPSERRLCIPSAEEPGFVPAITDLCDTLDVDVLVPGVDEELQKLDGLDLADTAVMVPNPAFTHIALDKWLTHRALAMNGIDTALTWQPEQAAEIPMPCIIKPRRARGSRGLYVIDLPEQIKGWKQLYRQEAVIQQQLVGQEYTVILAAGAKGNLEAVVPIKVGHAGLKRGITYHGVTERRLDVIDYCERIHNALGGSACYNVQLMVCDDGRIAAFEINPRVSGSFCLVIAAGIDPIAIFLGERVGVSFKSGVRHVRHWETTFCGL